MQKMFNNLIPSFLKTSSTTAPQPAAKQDASEATGKTTARKKPGVDSRMPAPVRNRTAAAAPDSGPAINRSKAAKWDHAALPAYPAHQAQWEVGFEPAEQGNAKFPAMPAMIAQSGSDTLHQPSPAYPSISPLQTGSLTQQANPAMPSIAPVASSIENATAVMRPTYPSMPEIVPTLIDTTLLKK